jgi:GGDEF domain-containing protein
MNAALMDLLADCADALSSGASLGRLARRVEQTLPCSARVEGGELRLEWKQPPSVAERSFARALVAMTQLARPAAQDADAVPLDPHGFLAALERAAAAARWRRQPLSLVLLEVEGMTLGPGVDERELVDHVGAIARACVRADDMVGHLGANQFALLLPRTGSFEARVALRRFRAALAESELRGEPLACELVAFATADDAGSASEMIAAARRRLGDERRRRVYRGPGDPRRPLAG